MMNDNLKKGFLTILVGLIIWHLPPPPELKPEALHLFAIFVAVILGFILKPLPMGAVAFIGLSVTSLSGVVKFSAALSGFSNPTIWLIVSAFILSRGFIKTGLGRRIAYIIMKAIGDSTLKLGYTLVLTNAIIGLATPSNTARVGGVLYPIVRGLSTAFGSEPGATSRKIGAYLIQLIYQADAIICAMFLTAMAGNPLIALLAAKTLNIEITWSLWAQASIVPGAVSLLVTPYLLYKIFPPEITKTPEAKKLAGRELEKAGPMTSAEKILVMVFISALALWVMNTINATIVALLGVSVMLATKVIDWEDVTAEKGAWDTLIWMGTVVSLADSLASIGFIYWFANMMGGLISGVSWIPTFLFLLLVYVYAHYCFASLTAHITAMYAAFCAVAVAVGAPVYLVALSLAFMSNLCMPLTHYGGGPAPILFGAGYVEQGVWWKLGFILTSVNVIIWVALGAVWWKFLGLW